MQLISLIGNRLEREAAIKSVSERLNLSGVNMDRGAIVCEKQQLKVKEQFQNNMPQLKIRKTLS